MLTDILAQQRRSGLAGFQGASIKARIPIREGLLNEAAQALTPKTGNGKAGTLNRITILDNNILVLNVTAKVLLFTQTLNLELALDPIIDFPRDPVFRARPARSLGILGVLGELFSTALPLPPYAAFANQTVTVNLKDALAAHGYADFAPVVQYVGITTEAGVLYLDLRFAVL